MAFRASVSLALRRQSIASSSLPLLGSAPFRRLKFRSPSRRALDAIFERQPKLTLMFPAPDQSKSDRTLQAVEALCDRVTQVENLLSGGNLSERLPSDEKLAGVAAALSRMRRRRSMYFSPDLFAEPGWDMLLDLFINQVRGLRVATTSLCLAGNAPQATGLRYISRLEEDGLLRRFSAPEDKRMVLIEITAKGYGQMRKCLGELVLKFGYPLPE